MMDRMARARVPLLDAEPADDRSTAHRLRLTDTGPRVLAGEADHVTLNGIDRWIGGVHLRGHRRPVALGRRHRDHHRASWKMTPSAVRRPRVTVETPCRMPTRW